MRTMVQPRLWERRCCSIKFVIYHIINSPLTKGDPMQQAEEIVWATRATAQSYEKMFLMCSMSPWAPWGPSMALWALYASHFFCVAAHPPKTTNPYI